MGNTESTSQANEQYIEESPFEKEYRSQILALQSRISPLHEELKHLQKGKKDVRIQAIEEELAGIQRQIEDLKLKIKEEQMRNDKQKEEHRRAEEQDLKMKAEKERKMKAEEDQAERKEEDDDNLLHQLLNEKQAPAPEKGKEVAKQEEAGVVAAAKEADAKEADANKADEAKEPQEKRKSLFGGFGFKKKEAKKPDEAADHVKPDERQGARISSAASSSEKIVDKLSKKIVDKPLEVEDPANKRREVIKEVTVEKIVPVEDKQVDSKQSLETTIKTVPSDLTMMVTIESARHLPKMDMLGRCDAFCEVEWEGQNYRTSVKKNSYSPDWNETFNFRVDSISEGVSSLTVRVMDWDRGTQNDVVGEVVIPGATLRALLQGPHAATKEESLAVMHKGKAVVGNDTQPCVLNLKMRLVPPQPDMQMVSNVETNPVTVAGVVGRKADILNGVYLPIGVMYNGKPLFRKRDDPDKWLRFNTLHNWCISPTSSKDANDVMCWCSSINSGMDLPTKVDKWKINSNGAEDKWQEYPPMRCFDSSSRMADRFSNTREYQSMAEGQVVGQAVMADEQVEQVATSQGLWGDIMSVLFPREIKVHREQKAILDTDKIVGIGIGLRRDVSESLLIHEILPGGAASQTHMFQLHDEVIEIDGVNVRKFPLKDVSALIMGRSGTMVSLTIFRKSTGENVLVHVQRAENPFQNALVKFDEELVRSPNHNALGLSQEKSSDLVYLKLPNSGSVTALHTVVILSSRSGEGALEEMAGLLMAGHDVNARDADGCTPIFYAAGSKETMQFLLYNKAEVNITNRLGNSPLHYAAAKDSVECTELLVRYGADRSIRCGIGLTPLQLASSLRKDQAVEYLRKLEKKQLTDLSFSTLPETKLPLNKQLLVAIAAESPVTDGTVLSTLIQAGADPNSKDEKTGMYALHLAIFQQSHGAVHVLLMAGAEPGYMQDSDDWRDMLLPIACALIDRKVLEQGKGAERAVDQSMCPPLVLRELLERDCDINSEIFLMDNIFSPLHLAIVNNDMPAAQLLIEMGADLDLVDKHGQTPEELANGGFLIPGTSYPKMCTLFARRQGSDQPFRSDTAIVAERRAFCRPLRPLPDPLPKSQQGLDLLLGKAASEGDRYNVIKVCKHGANISMNYTIQELTGSLRTVEVMLEQLGAKITSTGVRSGFSALHVAAQGGNCNVVRYLIKSGAKVNEPVVSGIGHLDDSENFLGYTPLMLAVMAKDPWSVNELLQAGAQSDVMGQDKMTPMKLLQKLGSSLPTSNFADPAISRLSLLLEKGAKSVPRPRLADRSYNLN